jgi:hypothetical protein
MQKQLGGKFRRYSNYIITNARLKNVVTEESA